MDWNHKTELVAIDTETTGISRTDYPFAVSLCDDQGNNILYEWDVNPKTRIPKAIKSDIRDIRRRCKGKTLIFHNLPFDIQKLEMVGCVLRWRHRSYDTQVEWHIIDSYQASLLKCRLKEMSLFYLDIPDDDQSDLRKAVSGARRIAEKLRWKIATKSGRSKDDHLFCDYWLPKAVAKHEQYEPDHPWHSLLAKYANTDTERTMLLHLLAQRVMSEWDSDDPRHKILDRERKLTNVLYDMGTEGVSIFPRKIRSEIERYYQHTSHANMGMKRIAGQSFNVESTQQLIQVLFDELRLPTVKQTQTGNQSTDIEVRERLIEYVEHNGNRKQKRFITAWNEYKGSISSIKYLKSYDQLRHADILYPSLRQTGTQTTRLSSENPNGQNVKKGETKDGVVLKEGLRNVFGPHKGRVWFCFDYSQLQLRIFAYLTGEQSMIEAFNHGYDFHGFIASKIFHKEIEDVSKMERRIGKNVNFGFIFGASPSKIERTAGVSGLWTTVCKMFPSAHAYMQSTKRKVQRYGYVTTPHGYRLYVDQPHKGVNYIVQGCEGDIVKQGMVNCELYLSELQAEGFTGYMCFTVHDELIFDFPKRIKHYPDNDEPEVINTLKSLMEQPGTDIGMITPVDVEYTTTNWAEVKPYEN